MSQFLDSYIKSIQRAADEGPIDWDVIGHWQDRVEAAGEGAPQRYSVGVRNVDPTTHEQRELLKAYASVVPVRCRQGA